MVYESGKREAVPSPEKAPSFRLERISGESVEEALKHFEGKNIATWEQIGILQNGLNDGKYPQIAEEIKKGRLQCLGSPSRLRLPRIHFKKNDGFWLGGRSIKSKWRSNDRFVLVD